MIPPVFLQYYSKLVQCLTQFLIEMIHFLEIFLIARHMIFITEPSFGNETLALCVREIYEQSKL